MVDIPKLNDKDTIEKWLREHDGLSIEELSARSSISINKLKMWKIMCDVINPKEDADIFVTWVKYKNYTIRHVAMALGIQIHESHRLFTRHGLANLSEENWERRNLDKDEVEAARIFRKCNWDTKKILRYMHNQTENNRKIFKKFFSDREYAASIDDGKEPETKPMDCSKETMERLLKKHDCNISSIARELKVCRRRVYYRLEKAGIDIKEKRKELGKEYKPLKYDKKWLKEQLKDKSISNLAKELGVRRIKDTIIDKGLPCQPIAHGFRR